MQVLYCSGICQRLKSTQSITDQLYDIAKFMLSFLDFNFYIFKNWDTTIYFTGFLSESNEIRYIKCLAQFLVHSRHLINNAFLLFNNTYFKLSASDRVLSFYLRKLISNDNFYRRIFQLPKESLALKETVLIRQTKYTQKFYLKK